MIQLRQTVTYSLSIQAMIKRENGRSAYQFSESDLVGGLIADLADPDILSPEDTWPSILTPLQKLDLKNDILSGCSKYHEYIRYCKNSIAKPLTCSVHKILIMSLNPAVKMDTMPLLQLKLQPLTVIRSWLIIRKSLINIWLLLTLIDGSQKRYEIFRNSSEQHQW